jgi:uncharacterized membrane protein
MEQDMIEYTLLFIFIFVLGFIAGDMFGYLRGLEDGRMK